MADLTKLARSHDRVVRICETTVDARTLRLAVLEEIGTVLQFDAYAWLLTDPETWVGSSPLADVPCLPELPRLIRLKYLTAVNRWTRLDGSAAALNATTAGALSQSLVWRELLVAHHVVDVASVVFVDQFGCWGFLDLWRMTPDVFTAAEVAFLSSIASVVAAALRRGQAHTFTLGATQSIQRGPVMMLLASDLTLRAQTPETDDYLRLLVPPDDAGSPVPASAYNVAAQLLAVEQGVDAHPATVRAHLAGGRWLTLRAARIEDARPARDRDIAVTIEDSSPAERTDLFARANGLSPRETELLSHIAGGRDTRDVANLMFLSPHTVQDHLKSIFAKTGVNNRRALLSRALGT